MIHLGGFDLKTRKDSEWRDLIRRWKESGMSRTGFAEANGIIPSSFHAALKRYGFSNPRAKPDVDKKEREIEPVDGFVEVVPEIVAKPQVRISSSSLKITTSYGAIVEVPL